MTLITDYDRAIVRAVPQAYAPAYLARGIRIDAAVADAQHAEYVAALRRAGVIVTVIPADEELFDCVFVEDTAIVWGNRALVTCMSPHREGEQRGVVAALEKTHTLSRLSAGARLEGGDVLHVDEVTYVGLSGRTNERGADQLAEFLGASGRPVVRVPVHGALHLKTAVTYLGNGGVLAAPGHVDLRAFEVDEVIETARGEEAFANCVRVRETLLVRRGCVATRDRLRRFAARHAVSLMPLDLSEFEKGGGSATCLSLLWQV